MTVMPAARNSLPAMPPRAHEGESRNRYASFARYRRATSTATLAPTVNSAVRSLPMRVRVSGSVSYTRPLIVRTGGRGQGNPPSISGQTGITRTPWASRRRIVGEMRPGLACQRHVSPQRQADATTVFRTSDSIFLGGPQRKSCIFNNSNR